LLVSLVVSSVLSAVSVYFMPEPGVIAMIVDFLISLVMITGIFAVLFKFIPDVKIHWRDVLPGAILTAVLFTIGRTVLATYLGVAFAVSLYGAAGSLVALMLWVYYSAQIVFFGAEFTKTYANWRTGRRS
jgi:membrane protein